MFLLLFARLGALVMLMPGTGEQPIPVNARLGIALTLSLVFYPTVAGTLPQGLANDLTRLVVAMIGEILIGIAIGLIARIMMSVTQIAGTNIASQIGLGFAMSVDPTMGQQGAIVAGFLSVTAMVLIFAADIHHIAIAAIADSYTMFPPGSPPPIGDFADVAVTTVGEAFKIGIEISAPFIVFGLVFNFGLGVLAKLMPQLQVFFLAMPVSIGVGLILFAFLVTTMMGLYASHLEDGLMRFIGP
nr:flagellar biosynthetic protein FliR [Chthonobacter albigriseus]